MIKVSVITINYNNAEGLRKTIKSVAEQTFREYEYIVIDGGSDDGSKEIIAEHQNQLSYWCSEKDSGIYNAMNKGILKAKGDYLLFLNSGDCLHNSAVLEEVSGWLSGDDIIYGDLMYVGDGSVPTVYTYPDVLNIDYFLEHSLGHPASFIKRELFKDCLYAESLKIVSDWEFFVKKIVLEEVSYKHIAKTITDFDMGGISSRLVDVCNEERMLVLKRLFPGMVYDALQQAMYMRKQPLHELFCELSTTRRFQYRIKPLIAFLLRLNKCLSRRK